MNTPVLATSNPGVNLPFPGVVTIVNYWFSSTQGSADKTVAITRMADGGNS